MHNIEILSKFTRQQARLLHGELSLDSEVRIAGNLSKQRRMNLKMNVSPEQLQITLLGTQGDGLTV